MYIFSLFEICKNLNFVKNKCMKKLKKIVKIFYNEEMNLIFFILIIYLGK